MTKMFLTESSHVGAQTAQYVYTEQSGSETETDSPRVFVIYPV